MKIGGIPIATLGILTAGASLHCLGLAIHHGTWISITMGVAGICASLALIIEGFNRN